MVLSKILEESRERRDDRGLKFNRRRERTKAESIISLAVRMAAFQAVDPGSIPGHRSMINLFLGFFVII